MLEIQQGSSGSVGILPNHVEQKAAPLLGMAAQGGFYQLQSSVTRSHYPILSARQFRTQLQIKHANPSYALLLGCETAHAEKSEVTLCKN